MLLGIGWDGGVEPVHRQVWGEGTVRGVTHYSSRNVTAHTSFNIFMWGNNWRGGLTGALRMLPASDNLMPKVCFKFMTPFTLLGVGLR